MFVQTFAEAERAGWKSMEREWEREKEKILNSLLGSTQELEFPTEAEVQNIVSYHRYYSTSVDMKWIRIL